MKNNVNEGRNVIEPICALGFCNHERKEYKNKFIRGNLLKTRNYFDRLIGYKIPY